MPWRRRVRTNIEISTCSLLIPFAARAVGSSVLTLFVRNFISGEKKVKQQITRLYAIVGGEFELSMSELLGPPILSGNRISLLDNGVEIFPAMLAGIARAEKTICFATYIYWSGETAGQFSIALSTKAREGVKVHVLIDGMGCDCVEGKSLRRMREAGAQVEVYHLHPHNLTNVNPRTHRKLLVIDGKQGFTGGVGIGDPWLGSADTSDHWRDSHYQVDGPAVPVSPHLRVCELRSFSLTSNEVVSLQ